MKNAKWTEEEIQKLAELCKSGNYTFEDMVSILNRPKTGIMFKCYQLKLNNNWQTKPKYIYNRDYFKEVTLENSYWTGILATDGHINYHGGSPNIVWATAIKDLDHIKLFLKNIESNHPIKIGKKICSISKDQKTEFEYSRLSIYSCHEWAKDLEQNFGFTVDKTLRMPPPKLPSLKHELAFIKGMIDGDGCITKNGKDEKIHIKIVGCNKEMLIWIKKIIDSIEIKSLAKGRVAQVAQDEENTYSYSVRGLTASILIEIMMKINTPFLQRKWRSDLVLENLNYWKSRSEWPNQEFFDKFEQ
jgi:hypothetical protein